MANTFTYDHSAPTVYISGKVQQQILQCLLSEIPIANSHFPATLALSLKPPVATGVIAAHSDHLPAAPKSDHLTVNDHLSLDDNSGRPSAPANAISPFWKSIGTCTKDTLFVELLLSNLSFVALTRSLPLMRSMLTRHANVNYREPATGRTPLHWVMLSQLNIQVGEESMQCFEPFFRGACLLLANGADETILDHEGKAYVDYLNAEDREKWDLCRQELASQLQQSSFFVDTVLNA